jgi:hypothetical protein
MTKQEKEQLVTKDNFMVLTFGYNHSYVLPHKDAITILAAFKNAETYTTSFDKPNTISPLLITDSVSAANMSQVEYVQLKMHHLLGVGEKGKND